MPSDRDPCHASAVQVATLWVPLESVFLKADNIFHKRSFMSYEAAVFATDSGTCYTMGLFL